MAPEFHLETKVVHAGEPRPRLNGSVVFPIFQSAMFESAGERTYDEVRYLRLNNTPSQLILHQKLASLENAEAALVTSSGMAAISTAFFAVLSTGDHLLVQDHLYGGTHDLVTHDFPHLGFSFDFIDSGNPDSWKSKLKPNTRAIYVETISNPLLRIPELSSVVDFARANNLVSMIDSTFASPVNFRPPEIGFDLSLHSCTKYLNGHSDIVAGAVIGRADLVDRVRFKLNHLGGSLDPHAAYLLSRGMRTLSLRVGQQNRSALEIARFLESAPQIERVHYPGLESHPNHDRAKRYLNGFGGMLSFELKGGTETAIPFLQKVKIPLIAPSLGGVETLMTRPATTSHAGMSAEDRRRVGISDSLIRMSVGIESTEDLIDDLKQALL